MRSADVAMCPLERRCAGLRWVMEEEDVAECVCVYVCVFGVGWGWGVLFVGNCEKDTCVSPCKT